MCPGWFWAVVGGGLGVSFAVSGGSRCAWGASVVVLGGSDWFLVAVDSTGVVSSWF